MLKPVFTKHFRKQYKLMKRRGLDINKLQNVIDMITYEQPLPPECQNHPLHGEYKGKLECHVESDWLLIYAIDQLIKEVIFYRTGSHSDLF